MGWIGVGFDGTLAEYHGYTPVLGKPIPAMVVRVRKWIENGHEVRIFTARPKVEWSLISRWCLVHIGHSLQCTNEKTYQMEVLFDDRVVQVEGNTGALMTEKCGDIKPLLGHSLKIIREIHGRHLLTSESEACPVCIFVRGADKEV